jgi:hypothetical protein
VPSLSLQGKRLLSWARLDDSFHDHPKIVGLDLRAISLWTKALSYCGRHLTDGVVPVKTVIDLTGLPRTQALALARKLVAAKLWEPVGAKAFKFHDYLTYQSSKADVDTLREAKRRAGQLGAQSRWQRDGNRHHSANSSRMATSPPITPPIPSPPPIGEVEIDRTRSDGPLANPEIAIAPQEGIRKPPEPQYTTRPDRERLQQLTAKVQACEPQLSELDAQVKALQLLDREMRANGRPAS